MSVTINGTNGLTFNDNTTQATSPFAGGLGFRNRIINGDMRIDQRNNGASVTPSSLYSTYTLDRWNTVYSVGSKFSVQQNAGSVTPPTGFQNYLGVTSLSAYTPVSAEQYTLVQNIEGFNVADLGFGAAGASTVTLSFWVRSSLTGTFGGVLGNSAANRTYPFTYAISAANTWEQKTITVAGDTTGTWLKTNGTGMQVIFSLGTGPSAQGPAGSWAGATYTGATGQTNIVSTNGATFYITGVQLEKGSTATSFDYRPYGTEDALCKRYAYKIDSASAGDTYLRYFVGECLSTTVIQGVIPLPVQMRIAPSLTAPAASQFAAYSTSTIISATVFSLGSATNVNSASLTLTVASGLTAGRAAQVMSNNNNTSYLLFTAEL